MTVDLEQLRRDYNAVKPALDTICEELHAWLKDTTRQLGIVDPRISSRVKETPSLLLKALKREYEGKPWDRPLEEASDKVGLRVDVVYLAEVDHLRDALCAATDRFLTIEVDDKLKNFLGEDRLGYRGVHFDVVPRDLPDGIDSEMAKCEIQVRTNAQAAWAMATHDLVYKGPVEAGEGLKRRVNRLTALLELFDEVVDLARSEMMGKSGYPLAIVVKALESAMMTFAARPYDRELTRTITTALTADLDADGAHQLARDLSQFAVDHHDKLATLYDRIDSGHPMLGQPESLLIFCALEGDKYMLQERWVDAELPYPFLDALATAWGVPLPAPH